jgi:hypothetical protein
MFFSEAKRKLLEAHLRQSSAPLWAEQVITPRPRGAAVPLSLSQEQLFLRETGTPGIPPLYNECITLRMIGRLDVPALEQSLKSIIGRHEIWRTSYDTSTGQPLQVVHGVPEKVSLEVIDLRSISTSKREAEAEHVVEEFVRRPFGLRNGPMLRFRLLRVGNIEYRLFLIAHLSIVDGMSVYEIWPSELAALYSSYSSGQPSPLSPLAVQFGDYAYWQRNCLQQETLAKQLAYWRRQLAGKLPVLNWPIARADADNHKFRGAIRPFGLSGALSQAVKELSNQEGATLFMVLLAACATLLFVYTEQDDIIVGTPSPAGRKRSEVERLLGYFLNPVALRFDLTGNPTFRDLLRQAQTLTVGAICNDDVPLELLTQEFQDKAAIGRPLFRVAISLQPPMPRVGLDWTVTSMDVASGGAPWDLYVAFIDRPTGIIARIQYNPDLFEIRVITELVQHLKWLLEYLCANPRKRLSDAKSLLKDRPCAV